MVRAVDNVVGNRAVLGNRPRVPGLDVFRGVAVTCMVLVHTARLAHDSANDHAKDSPFRACLSLFEPAISVAFLWLVGWSLHRSYAGRAIGAAALPVSQTGTAWRHWYRRCALRATALYAIGVVLFLLQYGVQSPDVWASPDILSSIGWGILVVGVLLPLGTRGLLGGAVALLAVLATVQVAGVDVSGINAGPGATVPLVAIACLGACHGFDGRRSTRVLWALAGVCAALVALAFPGELVDQHASRYANGTVWFWNHTLRGIALYGGGVVAFATAFAQTWRLRSRTWLWESAWVAPLTLLGRHALLTYVGHLLLLGAVDRWLPLPPHWSTPHWSTLVTLSLALLGAFMGIAMVLESKHARRVQRALRYHLGLSRNSNS